MFPSIGNQVAKGLGADLDEQTKPASTVKAKIEEKQPTKDKKELKKMTIKKDNRTDEQVKVVLSDQKKSSKSISKKKASLKALKKQLEDTSDEPQDKNVVSEIIT